MTYELMEDEITQGLIAEFARQRQELQKMIDDLQQLKENLDILFPKTLDVRFAKSFEEKIKTATSLFNVILDIRKELIKSVREEFDVRLKVKKPQDINLHELIDVRKLSRQIEKLKDNKLIKDTKLKLLDGEKRE